MNRIARLDTDARIDYSRPVLDHLQNNRLFDMTSGLNAHTLWLAAVAQYSSRHLSRLPNQPPEISGLAAYFSEHLKGDTYLVGIWECDVLHSLAWSSVQTGAEPAIPGTPGWS